MRWLVTVPHGSWQALPTHRQAAAQEHLAIATTMYRSIETTFWLQQIEVESSELGWIPRRAESFSMGIALTNSGFRHLACCGRNRRGLLLAQTRNRGCRGNRVRTQHLAEHSIEK